MPRGAGSILWRPGVCSGGRSPTPFQTLDPICASFWVTAQNLEVTAFISQTCGRKAQGGAEASGILQESGRMGTPTPCTVRPTTSCPCWPVNQGTLHGRAGNYPSLPCLSVWKPIEFSSSDILGVICLGNRPWPIKDQG